VLRKLREQENTKHLPVVAVSSFAMVGDRDKALRAGFDGYLSKPINARTFLNEVFQIAKIKID
jgi:CheY-like chemotaxis protein